MSLAVAPALDLGATVGRLVNGRRDPTARLGPGELWWAARTPEGPGTLHLRQVGQDVAAEAWGDGRAWLLDQVPALLGEGDDEVDFDPQHPVVRRAWRRHPGLRIGRSGLVMPALIAAVLAQRVTGREATAAWAALARTQGEPAPGPAGLLLPPDPDWLAGHPSWWFHPFGIERRRADTLLRACRHAPRLQEATHLPLADAVARLQAVPGIGPWTVAEATATALGDADAVPVGDYHIPSTVSWALAREPRGTDARMLDLLAPYAGHRGRVIRLLERDGHRAPRFGPRRGILPIARW